MLKQLLWIAVRLVFGLQSVEVHASSGITPGEVTSVENRNVSLPTSDVLKGRAACQSALVPIASQSPRSFWSPFQTLGPCRPADELLSMLPIP